MPTAYTVLKLIHILAAAIWFGAGVTMTTILLVAAGRRDAAGLRSSMGLQMQVGPRVFAPAALTTLLTGFAAVGIGHLGWPLWVWWGIVGVALSFTIGGALLRKGFMALSAALEGPDERGELAAAAAARVKLAATVNLLILASVFYAMVFKP